LQVAAYCLLVEETHDITVPYGLIRYPDQLFRVDFSRTLRHTLLGTLRSMRSDLQKSGESAVRRNHDDRARCRGCGYRHACGQDLR